MKIQSRLTIGEQLALAFKQANQCPNCPEKYERMAYYYQLMKAENISAAKGFDKYKGTWAYSQWIKETETVKLINYFQIQSARMGWT